MDSAEPIARPPTSPWPLIVLAWGLIGGIFILDTSFAGVSIGLLYVGVLLVGLWMPKRRFVLYLAAGASILEIVAYASRSGGAYGVVNLGLSLAVLWITAFGVSLYRRAAENRRLVEQHAQDFQRALDLSAIVAITDVRGTITYVNDAFCRISGFSRPELLGQDHRIVNSGLHPPDFFRSLYRTIGAGEVWRGEIRNKTKQGTYYWVDTTIVPFMDARNHPYQYVSIRYDVTERKLAERRLRDQESLAKLGQMAAVVAHEVKNPLAGIRGALQVISRRQAHPTEQQVIGEIIERIDTLSAIVQDLLEFARPRRPVFTTVPLSALVTETIALAKHGAELEHVEFHLDLDDVAVKADRELLRTALLNLFINAAQAMKGRGQIWIGASVAEGRCALRIRDEGPGMPADVQARLFEPFFTTKHRGTGLGLATTKRVVELHGGTIDFDCPSTGGTTAVVTLPVALRDDQPGTAAGSPVST